MAKNLIIIWTVVGVIGCLIFVICAGCLLYFGNKYLKK